MNSMNLKLALVTAATLCALSANATGLLNDSHDTNTTNAPVANGGNAAAGAVAGAVGIGYGQGGAGGSSAVLGSGNSSVRNDVKNTNANVQGQQQGQTQSSRNSNSNSAAGGNAAGGASSASSAGGQGGSSGGNQFSVAGDSTIVERSAPVAYAPDGKAPRTSCRLFVGFGGSGTGGALSGGIPIGNDQTCVSGAQIEFMDKVNKVRANTFGAADYLRAACKAEGMGGMDGCKDAAKKAEAPADAKVGLNLYGN